MKAPVFVPAWPGILCMGLLAHKKDVGLVVLQEAPVNKVVWCTPVGRGATGGLADCHELTLDVTDDKIRDHLARVAWFVLAEKLRRPKPHHGFRHGDLPSFPFDCPRLYLRPGDETWRLYADNFHIETALAAPDDDRFEPIAEDWAALLTLLFGESA